MNLTIASKSVKTLMSQNYTVDGKIFNLNNLGWSFNGFDRGVKRLGHCSYNKIIGKKIIGLSKKMTELREQKEVEQTILHEIAHAIDFEIRQDSGHDYKWQSIARQIGYEGERTTKVSNEAKVAAYKWVAICPEHGIIGGWTRKPKNMMNKLCKKCHKSILIVPATDKVVTNLMK